MKEIYDNVSATCSKAVTKAYSTSFSSGILFLAKKFRNPIYGIYGFVRLADEIVDSFHNFDKPCLMEKFRKDTMLAIEQKISLNPILNEFQRTVHHYNIEWDLIDIFLKSMEMDLEQKEHDKQSYETYVFGSAEVVGLMCLRVFMEGNNEYFEKLKPFAAKLGSAFQKVNFLRDLHADYGVLGRTYFPEVDFKKFSQEDKIRIQHEIETEFELALIGIKMLPLSSRKGVYLAYYYYKKLFHLIKETPADKLMLTRIRIPDASKLGLMLNSFVRTQLNLL